MKTIYFDLDGTLFNLYGKNDWLKRLEAEDETVFNDEHKTDFFFNGSKEFNSVINKLMESNVCFEVITWLPMNASKEYENKCEIVKRKWVEKNLPFVRKVHCLSYGIPKQTATNRHSKDEKILIDDSAQVCQTWNTKAMRKSYNINKRFTALDALKEILATL